MIYKCSKCGFIHEGEMPDGYFCPLCQAGSFAFNIIKSEEKNYRRVIITPDNPGINRIDEKCINCGACQNTCQNIVGIHFDKEPVCISCGKCILSCPTGSLTPKYNYQTVWELLNVPGKKVVAITSPAVRVGVGDAFGFDAGSFLEGKMVAALKALGFAYVYDAAFGADLNVMEEAAELKERLHNNELLPMFNSCCPAWVKYAHVYHADLLKHISSCKSPIGMQAAVLKEIFAQEEKIAPDDLIIVAITPCTAKKGEIIDTPCDYVLTTSELALLIREQGVDFKNLADESFDSIIGSASGVGFGVTGGVTLSLLKVLYYLETNQDLTNELILVKPKDFYTEYQIKIKDKIIKCAALSTLPNWQKMLSLMKEFHFIEIMNCAGGCIGGGGQIIMPIKDHDLILKQRKEGLTKRGPKENGFAYKNALIKDLYADYLEHPLSIKARELLHYEKR